MERITLLRVLAGSRAYGLEREGSDWDYHSVFVAPTRELLAVEGRVKTKVWQEGEEDNTGWEVGHFLKLALHCNPTVLETFVAPILGPGDRHSYGERDMDYHLKLRALFPAVLSRRAVYDAFKGYAHSQRRKMLEPTGGVLAGERVWKFATAYLRVLWQGRVLLETGRMPVYVNDPFVKELLETIRDEKVSEGQVIDWAMSAQHDLALAFGKSTLPTEPDLDAVNDFLWRLRREYW